MKKSRFYFMFLLLACVSISTQAREAEYNTDSKELTIRGVKVDGNLVFDVKVKLNDFEFLEDPVPSIEEPVPSTRCPAQTVTNFTRIENGMTLDQVNSIIGCNGVLLETDFDDGLLKTKYLWEFDNAKDASSVVLAFEHNILIL